MVNQLLHIETKIVYSSDCNISSKSTQLLIDLIKYYGGNTYISGDGAEGYQKEDLFYKNKIKLVKNNFYPRPYFQLNSKNFVPGLSIIDALFNLRLEDVKILIE